jgi:arylsulfatase A-like enzyme
MITGMHQNIIGAHHHRSNRKVPLPSKYKPITAYLREAGYTTVLGYNGQGKKVDANFAHKALGKWDGVENFGIFDSTDSIKNNTKPFFCQVTLTASHRNDHWDRISEQSTNRISPNEIELPPYMADHPTIREDWAKYLDQVEYMDYQVGQILDDLEKNGLLDKTIVIFSGDNGRCNIRGKGYLYEPGIKVALIVKYPGNNYGNVIENLISVTDISASILSLAGAEIPSHLSSQPFLGVEEPNLREYVYSARDLWDEILERSRSIVTSKYKYIYNQIVDQSYDAHQGYLEFYRPAIHIMRKMKKQGELTEVQERFFAEKPVQELYDLQNDPDELNNLALKREYQNVMNELRGYIKDWQSKHTDLGLEHIDWDNMVTANAPAVVQWIKKEHPDVYEEMENGVEIGFGAWRRKYQEAHK